MRLVEAAEAREIIRKSREKLADMLTSAEEDFKARRDAEKAIAEIPLDEAFPDREIRPVMEALERRAEAAESVADDASQDALFAMEVKKINGFKRPASLEEYLLKKYRIPLLQRDLSDMKDDAKLAVQALAKDQKLYTMVE